MKKNKNKKDNKPVAKEVVKKLSFKQQLTYILLSISLISSITLFIITIVNSTNVIEHFKEIINVSLLMLFSLSFVLTALFADNKKGRNFAITSAFLLTLFTSLNILDQYDLVKLPERDYMPNWTNTNVIEVIKWAEKREIIVHQKYEASDSYLEYDVIGQSIEPDTIIKDLKELEVIVSIGPDENKVIIFPNMIGNELDDVIDFVEQNHFTNVNIDFEENELRKDLIIEQDKSGELPRNTRINLISSIGSLNDLVPIEMPDLKNKSEFYAITFLKRNGIKYKLEYDYDENIALNKVIKQNKKKGTIVNTDDTVILTISKGNKIVVPDLIKMSMVEINNWIISNKLKIEFEDRYSDSTDTGDIVEVSHKKGDIVEIGNTIKITISKGNIVVPSYNKLSQYISWGEKYGVDVKSDFEFNTQIEKGEIISLSKKKGSVLKDGESLTIKVSNGKALTVVNLLNKTRTQVTNLCRSNNLKCSFVNGYHNTVASGYSIRQTVAPGAKVSSDTIITVVMSIGKAQVAPPKPTTPPTPSCTPKYVVMKLDNGNSIGETQNIVRSLNPQFKFNFVIVRPGSGSTGWISPKTLGLYDGKSLDICKTYTIEIIELS